MSTRLMPTDCGSPTGTDSPREVLPVVVSVLFVVGCLLLPVTFASAAQPKSDDPPANTDPPAEPPANAEEEKLPKLDEMLEHLPTAAELLQDPHRDWIVLLTDEVVVCEPVYPRPDTKAKMQAKIDAYPSYRGPRTPEAIAADRARFRDLHYLNVVLPGDKDAPEYRLDMKYIAQIIHHEDLMLRRTDVMLSEGKYRDALEMLFVLQRSHPNWPGYADRRERLLYLVGDRDLRHNRPEAALVSLEELHDSNPKFEFDGVRLKTKLGEVADRLIAEAVEDEDFRRGRHFLLRLRGRDEKHAVVGKWADRLRGTSTEAINRADALFRSGRYAEAAAAADRAALSWPNVPDLPVTPGLGPIYDRVHSRYPRLKVGVVGLPGEGGPYFLPTSADRRRRLLTESALFEVDHSDDAPHYRSRLLEHWEPTDLGRRATFTLRQNRAAWETQPIVTATSALAQFADRLDPSSADYDERLDSFVSSVAVLSPFDFEVRFDHVPPHIESLLTFAVARPSPQADLTAGDSLGTDGTAGHAKVSRTLPVSATLTGGGAVSGPFLVHEQTDDRVVYRRSRPEPDDLNQFHVAEIVERRYPSYDKAVQGLLRGEVSLLPQVHSRDVPQLREDDRFRVIEKALPVTHLLQFNPRGRVMPNRELRRALAYALDRERVLRETVLGRADESLGRVVSGPFPTRGLSAKGRRVTGYAYNAQVEPRRYDRTLALSLAMAAAKASGGTLPELKLICDPDPVALAAAGRLVRFWADAGITVKLLTADGGPVDPKSSDWDIVYRTVRMAEPVVELWPLLTLEPAARVQSLFFLPDWLRQELIELDHVGDWKSAVEKLKSLHVHLAADVALIPLWEVDDYFVVRPGIRGYPDPPLFTYQGIERWTVKPWFASDLP